MHVVLNAESAHVFLGLGDLLGHFLWGLVNLELLVILDDFDIIQEVVFELVSVLLVSFLFVLLHWLDC